MQQKFRNRKSIKNIKTQKTIKGTIRDDRRKTQRMGFSTGGAFRIPKNPTMIRNFLDKFSFVVGTISPKTAVKNTKLLETILASGNLPALFASLQMDPHVVSMTLAFMIETYNNKAYYNFVKKTFRIDIETPTHKLMKLLTKRGSKGGAGDETSVVPKYAVVLSFKSLAISSLLSFLWFSICLYYTQHSLFKIVEDNMAIQFIKSGYDFMKDCKFVESEYKAKTGIEKMIQDAFSPFLQNPTDFKNFEGVMYVLRHCLKHPASKLQETITLNQFTNTQIAKLERIYNQKLIAKATPDTTPIVIQASMRESTVSVEPTYEHILPIEATKSRALVPLETPEELAFKSAVVSKILEKDPKFFDNMVKVMRTGIESTKSKAELKTYLEKMEQVEEQYFIKKILKKEDEDVFTIQSIMNKYFTMENFTKFLGGFVTMDLLGKFTLSQSGGPRLGTVLYIEYKKMMRRLLTNLEVAEVNTKSEFNNLMDDTLLIIEYTSASWKFIYIMICSFFSFSVSAFFIYLQSEAQRTARSRQILESTIAVVSSTKSKSPESTHISEQEARISAITSLRPKSQASKTKPTPKS